MEKRNPKILLNFGKELLPVAARNRFKSHWGVSNASYTASYTNNRRTGFSYDAAGMRRTTPVRSNQAFQPHRFATFERDANGGDEAMMRCCQSSSSRFNQPDPYDGSYSLANPQSSNRYTYTQNDPINFVDPSGLNKAAPHIGTFIIPQIVPPGENQQVGVIQRAGFLVRASTLMEINLLIRFK